MSSVFSSLALALQHTAPWLAPYLRIAEKILEGDPSRCVADALNEARDPDAQGPAFVEHVLLSAGEPYESFIARTGCVPTRDNLHDLFNGLMWLAYPQTKRRMNELQAQQIARQGVSGPRGPLRDALTVLDENGAVLHAPAALVDALRRRDWRALFIDGREQWQSARLELFGHALLEKLLQPRKAITAHVWLVDEISDDAIASSLTPQRLETRSFLPLPVLGVPGWWKPNEQPAFYDDAQVFRPQRLKQGGRTWHGDHGDHTDRKRKKPLVRF